MTTIIPVELRELLKKGEYITMIPKGSKPNMINYTFVEADSWAGAWYRMIHGENRHLMILEIKTIIDQFIIAIRNNCDTEYLPLLVDTLYRMKSGGINNLMDTYKDSPDILAELRVCISGIELHLGKFKQLIPGYRAPEAMQPVTTNFQTGSIIPASVTNGSTGKKTDTEINTNGKQGK